MAVCIRLFKVHSHWCDPRGNSRLGILIRIAVSFALVLTLGHETWINKPWDQIFFRRNLGAEFMGRRSLKQLAIRLGSAVANALLFVCCRFVILVILLIASNMYSQSTNKVMARARLPSDPRVSFIAWLFTLSQFFASLYTPVQKVWKSALPEKSVNPLAFVRAVRLPNALLDGICYSIADIKVCASPASTDTKINVLALGLPGGT